MIILSINFFITAVGFISLLVIFCLLAVLLHLIGSMVKGKQTEEAAPVEVMCVVSAAESAAIAMALHLCHVGDHRPGVHDEESNVITIRNVDNRYSPWSSKIYGIQ